MSINKGEVIMFLIRLIAIFSILVALNCSETVVGTKGSSSTNPTDAVAFNVTPGRNFYRLNKLFRGSFPLPGGMDHALNHIEHFDDAGGVDDLYDYNGLAWYVLNENEAWRMQGLTHTIHELYKNQNGGLNFMTSWLTNEGGYKYSSLLGNVFYSAQLEINGSRIEPDPFKPAYRVYRSWRTGSYWNRKYWCDHLTLMYGESAPGYGSPGLIGYGFPRYWIDGPFVTGGVPEGNFIPTHDAFISRGDVRIGYNYNAGGMITSLQVGGIEYINNRTVGRQLQICTFLEPFDGEYNPTEGGDWNNNGSPLIWHDKLSGHRFATRTMPLMFSDPDSPWPYTANLDQDHPLLYGGVIFKDVEILPNENGARVIRYDIGFDPKETLEWGHINLSLHVCNAAIYTQNNTFHRYYRRTGSGNFVEVSRVDIDNFIPNNPGHFWGGFTDYLQNQGVLIIAHGANRGIGIFIPTLSNTGCGMSQLVNPTTGGPNSWNCNQIVFNFGARRRGGPPYARSEYIRLTPQTFFWHRAYILVGRRQDIIRAANAFPW